ncbi:hypothetical protein [endosymbiont GvMRE of Glomus versiforme]|uniref:hypothetical protein n=1 Tax=endosymbiont GvMRE of Glomus versiforme TaxID=2039283 RepID=UPI000EEFE366|nr:hypothetical protein [endosymbiont GvMRE of Glomus versiforme]RHZ35422.1 hypothetical protein GvMRE_IIg375 [endosymbiont GvMRE of Glomus versiforme]
MTKNLKEKVLKNPEKWNVIFSESQSGFSVDDYRELKRAVIEKVIKPCKKGDWEVKNVLTMNGVYGKQEDTVLIHKSAKLKYDNEGILVWDLGKIHYKNAFDNEEWTEIEQVLSEKKWWTNKFHKKNTHWKLGVLFLIVNIKYRK